jgi:hypothetical protein
MKQNSGENNLNFFESMYHFRSMFPNVDTDVIECILQSNSGQIDTTIDQLLAMTLPHDTKANINDNGDLPPSYSEFMSAQSAQSSIITKSEFNETEPPPPPPPPPKTSNDYINKFNSIVIGDLCKDFLRVKLTSDQVKRIKSSIKQAKRAEFTALLNNKVPEQPMLSLEMKQKLNTLSHHHSNCSAEFETPPYEEKQQQQQQIEQDACLARLLQNETFLDRLRADTDFIQTLNHGNVNVKNFDLFSFFCSLILNGTKFSIWWVDKVLTVQGGPPRQ